VEVVDDGWDADEEKEREGEETMEKSSAMARPLETLRPLRNSKRMMLLTTG